MGVQWVQGWFPADRGLSLLDTEILDPRSESYLFASSASLPICVPPLVPFMENLPVCVLAFHALSLSDLSPSPDCSYQLLMVALFTTCLFFTYLIHLSPHYQAEFIYLFNKYFLHVQDGVLAHKGSGTK